MDSRAGRGWQCWTFSATPCLCLCLPGFPSNLRDLMLIHTPCCERPSGGGGGGGGETGDLAKPVIVLVAIAASASRTDSQGLPGPRRLPGCRSCRLWVKAEISRLQQPSGCAGSWKGGGGKEESKR